MHNSLHNTASQVAQLLVADVMHKRCSPRINQFNYQVYYLSLPLDALESNDPHRLGQLRLNRWGLHSFYNKDHGYRDERPLRSWINDILSKYQQPLWQDITLICMPRVLGYVFNPVSFWICRDDKQAIKAVVCEVNNTFGQTHTYLCLATNKNQSSTDTQALHDKEIGTITAEDWLVAEKCFHVSPFLPRQGEYRFRFNIEDTGIYINIDYYEDGQQKTLLTSLKGKTTLLSRQARLKAFMSCPWVTLKAITLIHYQALKLVLKKIHFFKLPTQHADKDSKTKN